MGLNLIEGIDMLQEGRAAEIHSRIPKHDGTGLVSVSIRFYPGPPASPGAAQEEDFFEVMIDGVPQVMTEGQLLQWIQHV